MIKDLLQPGSINSNTKIVLVNAIYFKGKWLNKFDKAKTNNEPFKLESGESVEVPMMTLEANLLYGHLNNTASVLKVGSNFLKDRVLVV